MWGGKTPCARNDRHLVSLRGAAGNEAILVLLDNTMIIIDGSQGEGGGQILRTSLALSIWTQQPIRIEHIRAKRAKPGLLRQHLTAVQAAVAISNGQAKGAELGSRALTFSPGSVQGGDYRFAIGTAGSCTLVLQTILFPLLLADRESTVTITGGTHNPGAPPVDFLQRAFLPLLTRMGTTLEVTLKKHGFFPGGGGEIVARIQPCPILQGLELRERGERRRSSAEAYIASLPVHIAERELKTVGELMSWRKEQLFVRGVSGHNGIGNALGITLEHEHVTEVFTGFGARGVSAETVAKTACDEALDYIASNAAVGSHLADQLLLPLALAGSGRFTMPAPTQHFTTNATVIKTFLPVRIRVGKKEKNLYEVFIDSNQKRT
jgi:RNA 3'-terminal phosphate cyclase (ATP)